MGALTTPAPPPPPAPTLHSVPQTPPRHYQAHQGWKSVATGTPAPSNTRSAAHPQRSPPRNNGCPLRSRTPASPACRRSPPQTARSAPAAESASHWPATAATPPRTAAPPPSAAAAAPAPHSPDHPSVWAISAPTVARRVAAILIAQPKLASACPAVAAGCAPIQIKMCHACRPSQVLDPSELWRRHEPPLADKSRSPPTYAGMPRTLFRTIACCADKGHASEIAANPPVMHEQFRNIRSAWMTSLSTFVHRTKSAPPVQQSRQVCVLSDEGGYVYDISI